MKQVSLVLKSLLETAAPYRLCYSIAYTCPQRMMASDEHIGCDFSKYAVNHI